MVTGPPLLPCFLCLSIFTVYGQELKLSGLGSLVNRLADDQGGVSREHGYTERERAYHGRVPDLSLLWVCLKGRN